MYCRGFFMQEGIAWFPPKSFSKCMLSTSSSVVKTAILWVMLECKDRRVWCRPLPTAHLKDSDGKIVASTKYSINLTNDEEFISDKWTVSQKYYSYESLKQVCVTFQSENITKELMSNVKIALLGSIVISNVIVRLHLSGKRVFAVLKHSQQIKSDVIPIISGETEIIFAPRHYSITNPSSIDSIKEAKNSLDLAYNRLFEAVCFPILHREAIGKFGLDLPKGVLISGPPGVGKTSLVRRIANVAKVPLLTIRGPELIGQNLGESEANLTERFRLAREAAEDTPLKVSILFLDEIDSIAMKRAAPSQSSSSIRLVSQLLILMDGIGSKISSEHSTVVVIAATNRPNTIDPALRRPGRFDREITIDPPNATERLEMLRGMIEEIPNIQCNANLQELAKATAGFVAADLNALLREAFLSSIDSLTPTILSDADFAAALKNVRPSLHREYSIAVEPNVTFESIGGYAQVKESLQRSLEWPLLHAASFARLGIRPPRGILLHGPPGCSKTTFAKAIANMASLNFYSLSGASVLSSYYGESERTSKLIVESIFISQFGQSFRMPASQSLP